MSHDNYRLIQQALRTCFNAEDGLSLETSVGLYVRNAVNTGQLNRYLTAVSAALSDPSVSWKRMFSNHEYEVQEFDTEAEAREYARRILEEPLERAASAT